MQGLITFNSQCRENEVSCDFRSGRFVLFSPGFTLIENLVAITVLAISLVAVFQLFSGSLKSIKASDDYTRGIFHARELLEEVSLSEQISEGELKGKFDDGYRWKTEIRRREGVQGRQARSRLELFEIKVSVLWDSLGAEKRFELMTMKIAAKSRAES